MALNFLQSCHSSNLPSLVIDEAIIMIICLFALRVPDSLTEGAPSFFKVYSFLFEFYPYLAKIWGERFPSQRTSTAQRDYFSEFLLI